MVGLADIPTEVLNEILRLLSLQEDGSTTFYRDLYNISLCSRSFHGIVEARLYSQVELSSSALVALITRTFLERPQLASLVSEATIDAYDSQGRNLGSDKLMDSFSLDRLHTTVKATGIPSYETRSWVDDFRDDHSDARAAFMVSMLPKLRVLSVTVSSHGDPLRYFKLLAQHASHSTSVYKQSSWPSILSTLQEVHIQSENSLGCDETLPIMNLSSLRTLYTYGLSNSRWKWEPPAGSSGLCHLQLDSCEMNTDELFHMLRSCRALRTFKYSWDQPCWCEEEQSDDEEDIGLDLGPIIVEGLSSSKPSLTSLKVHGSGAIRNDIRSFGSLVGFRNLQEIRAPSLLVLNASEGKDKHHLIDVLPAALKSLHLIIDRRPGEETLVAELLELIQSETHSMLCQISLERCRYRIHLNPVGVTPQEAVSLNRLQAACASAGISLQINLHGYSNKRATSSVEEANR